MSDRPPFCMELGGGLEVFLPPGPDGRGEYPSSTLCKGLLLRTPGSPDLCQEGVGFGVPVLKTRLASIFCGNVRVVGSHAEHGSLTVVYTMNLVDRLARDASGRTAEGALNVLKEIAAAIHRGIPFARRALTFFSNAVRSAAGISNVFVPTRPAGSVEVEYGIRPAVRPRHALISVKVDASAVTAPDLTRIVIMNELGADRFPRYEDSDGVVRDGEAVGTWNRVGAGRAAFINPTLDIGFGVKSLPGAVLYRGREREDGRLAWAGFGYELPGRARLFRYDIDVTGPADRAAEITPGARKWQTSF